MADGPRARGRAACTELFVTRDDGDDVLVMVLPLPPNLNREQRMHWAAKHRDRTAWYAAADAVAASPWFPPPPPRPFARVTVSALLVMPSAMDEDNAFRRASKWPMDWLRTRGYIADDSRKHVRWSSLPEQRITRRVPGRLELTLRPVAADDAPLSNATPPPRPT